MKDIRYHLPVKDDRAIWSAGTGLSEIIEEICETGVGLQEADR